MAFLLSAMLMLFASGACAQETTPLSVGDELCGFRVTQIVHNEQYGLDFVHMEHEKTGALLVYIPCEDIERGFCAAVRTPTENDKAIPHIYEHITLSGSEKYPDPSLLFSIINQTYNTFFNAGTYISNATYFSSSLSEAQLLRYADYILDGMYHPLIMTDERAMMREGYRYELADEDSPIELKGTVYSEMKGHTDLSTISNILATKALYPGSRFAVFKGGDPDVIPELTWQELKDFHDKYYHPSNSLTVLYGKLDPEPFLALIDGVISQFDWREIVLTDDGYAPLEGNIEQKRSIPVSADSPEEACIYYDIPLDGLTAHEMDVLSLYCGMYVVDGSPVWSLFAGQMPFAMPGCTLITDGPVPALRFSVVGAMEEEADLVKSLLTEGLAQTAAQGVDGDMMKAAATAHRLEVIAAREGSNKGVNIAEAITSLWGSQGDEMAYAEEDRRMAQALELADAETLRSIAEKYLANPQTSAYGVYVSAPGELEVKNAEEEARLVRMKEEMTDEARAALIAQTRDYYEWTEGYAANSMIDAVKVVDAQALPEEIIRYEAGESMQDGVRVLRADVNSDELVSVRLLFTADHIPYAQYNAFDTYIMLIGALNTQNYTTDALSTASRQISSGVSVYRDCMNVEDVGIRPVIVAEWNCLPENLDACYELARELIWRTDATDVDHARMALAENDQIFTMVTSMEPSSILMKRLPCDMNDTSRFDARMESGDGLAWSRSVPGWSDEEFAQLLERGKAMLLDAMRRENLTICAVGSKENNDLAVAAGLKFAAALSDEPGVHYDYAGQMEALPEGLAFPMDIDVGYNAIAMSFEGSGYEMSGRLKVLFKLLADRLLIPELRYRNACYGASVKVDEYGVQMFSYRDPGLAETYALFDGLGDRVRALEVTQEDIDGYIVNVFSQFCMPMGPMTGGRQAIDDRLCGRDTFETRLRYMREAKQTTPEDVAELAALLDLLAEKGARVSVNRRQLIEQNSELFCATDESFMLSGIDFGAMMME